MFKRRNFQYPSLKIDELGNIQKFNTYWGGRIVAVKAGVVRRPWPCLQILEEQLPDPFVCRAK